MKGQRGAAGVLQKIKALSDAVPALPWVGSWAVIFGSHSKPSTVGVKLVPGCPPHHLWGLAFSPLQILWLMRHARATKSDLQTIQSIPTAMQKVSWALMGLVGTRWCRTGTATELTQVLPNSDDG